MNKKTGSYSDVCITRCSCIYSCNAFTHRLLRKRDCKQSIDKTAGNCLVMFSWNFVIKQYVGSAFKESLVLFRPVVVFSLVFLNLVNYSYTACLELPLPLVVKDLES